MKTIILGIESSCDDTSAAVISDGLLLSNVIAKPEGARGIRRCCARVCIAGASAEYCAGGDGSSPSGRGMQGGSFGGSLYAGPGLLGSLHVGTSFAKGMALGLNAYRCLT